MYGIIDCDNCYVSCERVFRPDLNGKPVVVLSNNDGCVVARSNEAKAMGIKAGVPYYQLAEKFPDNKIAVFSSNYGRPKLAWGLPSVSRLDRRSKLMFLPMPSSTISRVPIQLRVGPM